MLTCGWSSSVCLEARGLLLQPQHACRAGSRACFQVATEYLAGFGAVPRALVVGNHDLEGSEFATDEANLAAWAQVRSSACSRVRG